MESVKNEDPEEEGSEEDESEEESEDEGEDDAENVGTSNLEDETPQKIEESSQTDPIDAEPSESLPDAQVPDLAPRRGRSPQRSDEEGPPDSELSDASSAPRALSRSPPRSRSFSSERAPQPSSGRGNIKDIVTSDLSKSRAQQQRKYHSKRGARRAGRPQGSKAKQDTRVKVDSSGFWD